MKQMLTFLLLVCGVLLVACASVELEEVSSAELTSLSTDPPAATQSPTPTLAPVVNTSTTDPPPPTATIPNPAAHLPILGAAPNITNDTWLNTGDPLTLEGMRGKVILLEFWTFG